MRAEQNILSRHYSTENTLSAGQLRLDATVGSFAEKAADPYSLAAVCFGGAAFRAVRGLGFSTLGGLVAESRAGAVLLNGMVNGGALVAEAGTFVSSERLLRVALGNADRSLLQWEGANGLKNAWASSVVNFGALRGAGLATAGTNGVLQHAGAVTAMVTANHASAELGLIEAHQGTLMDEIIEASVLDIQMKVGMGLLHTVAPGLAHWERSVDLAHEMRTASLGNAHELSGLSAHENILFSMGAEGGRVSRVDARRRRTEQALARDLDSFVRDVHSDERIEPAGKNRILGVLGAGEGVQHHTEPVEEILSTLTPNRDLLNRAKQVRDDILSDTHIPNEQIPFANFRHLLPNGVSLLAGVFGMMSVYASHEGRFHKAAYFLIAAAVADKMDGFFARQKWFRNPANPKGEKLDSKHPIGNFLDSMVDVSVYGVATGYFVYSVCSYLGIPDVGATIGTVGALNAMLRLAVFEFLGTKEGQKLLPARDLLHNPILGNGHGFAGRPSTLTAPEVAVLWLAAGNNHEFFLRHPYAFAVTALVSSVAMMAPFAWAKLTDGGLGTAFRSKAFVGSIAAGAAASVYAGDIQPLACYTLLWLNAYLYSPFINPALRWNRRRVERKTTGVRVDSNSPEADRHTESEGEAEIPAAVVGNDGRREGEE